MQIFFNHKEFPYKNLNFLWMIVYPLTALSFIFLANGNSFSQLLQIPSFYSDLLFAGGMTFLVGQYLKWISLRLDKHFSWVTGFKQRLIRQALWGVFIPLLFAIAMEVIYLYLIQIPLHSSSIIHLELPLGFILLLLFNLFYMVNYLFYYQKTEIIPEYTKEAPDFFTVEKGYTEKRLPVSACAYILSCQKSLWLHTYEGESFRVQGSLEDWEEKLKSANFYRLNRQYLVSVKAIESIEQTETRKLKVILHPARAEDVFVSKPKVTAFRIWWKKNGPS
ncbi:MAG: LytTR family transcriptional regulator DNA-binding domain-containing protein [Bacteroidia bacterium]|nr:LytTR family transcriptional regulator DNA-binding domain-containing protein [Bacteroidia bacterium]